MKWKDKRILRKIEINFEKERPRLRDWCDNETEYKKILEEMRWFFLDVINKRVINCICELGGRNYCFFLDLRTPGKLGMCIEAFRTGRDYFKWRLSL